MNFINGFIGIINSKALGEMAAVCLLALVLVVFVFIATGYLMERGGPK